MSSSIRVSAAARRPVQIVRGPQASSVRSPRGPNVVSESSVQVARSSRIAQNVQSSQSSQMVQNVRSSLIAQNVQSAQNDQNDQSRPAIGDFDRANCGAECGLAGFLVLELDQDRAVALFSNVARNLG